MKLLLITENWPPQVGGIERYLAGLTGALSEQGVEVDVVAPSVDRSKNHELRIKHGAVIRRRFFWPLLKPAWLPILWFIMRRQRAEKYQVVLCGKALFEGLVGLALKKRYGIPYVVFTYAMEIATWQQDARTRQKLVAVLREAAQVCFINEKTRSALRELGVRETQLLKMPPALEETAGKKVPEQSIKEALAKYSIQQPYILSVGRLILRKGFATLIGAFAALDQMRFAPVHLVIAGEGPERARLAAQASREMIESSVHLLSGVTDEELAALYAGAAVFALTPHDLPNDFEGFGIVYLEAAAHGVPAVATATGGAQEAVIHEQTGLLVPPDDVTALRDALARLLDDEALRLRLGAAARDRVRREFLWPARAAEFLKEITPIIR